MNNKILLLIALAAFCFSCSKDGGSCVDATEREVEMNFLLPGVTTRAPKPATAEEEEIKSLTVLVFNGDEDNSTYLYSRHAWIKTSGQNTYTTTMKIGTGYTIYFVVNRSTVLDDLAGANIKEEVSTWADVREVLIMDTPKNIDITGKGLPMWGMVKNQTISPQAANHLGTVQLIRSVALVEIYMMADDFTFEEGHVVFAANKGYMPYDQDKMKMVSGILRADSPYTPGGFQTNIDLAYTVKPADQNSIQNHFYIYENSTSVTTNSGTTRPTKVVLKGIWEDPDGSGESTYYPLSIRNKVSSNPDVYEKKMITRNNRYSIIIKNVHGDGYPNLPGAKDGDDVDWDYDVIEWDDNSSGDIFIDGSHFISIDSKTAELKYFKSTATDPNIKEIVFTTNWAMSDIKMTFNSGGTPTSGPVSNDRFKAEVLTVKEGLPGEYKCFRFTALQDYSSTAVDNPSTLYVTIGRVSFKITVTQLSRSAGNWDDGGGTGTDL